MKMKIGEILVTGGLITRKTLEESLDYQRVHGGNITQYLIARGYLKEEDLAKCLSIQFGYPYLPLRSYEIPVHIIRLVPVSIVQKYWLIPVDKIQNIITLVMADPFDEEAIADVEKATSGKVQPFVGVLSDILKAIEKYYGVNVGYEELKKTKESSPLFVAEQEYAGVERRRAYRIPVNIEVHFPLQNEYKSSKTKDVSTHGLLFESPNALPVGSILVMDLDLPRGLNPYPIPVIVKVARTRELADKKFDIGVEIVKIAKDDLDKVITYASSQAR